MAYLSLLECSDEVLGRTVALRGNTRQRSARRLYSAHGAVQRFLNDAKEKA
jgi:hypothetical protein